MKNNFLLVLLFLLSFAQTALSQKRLSPSLRPFAKNWTYTLVKSLSQAGFDLPSMPANMQQGAGTLQLDSTRTMVLYAPGDSSPVFRSTYAYPAPNTKVETNYQYDNGQWLPLNRSSLIVDSQGRLVEVTAEVFDLGRQAFIEDSKMVVYPHENSPELIDSLFTYLWDSTMVNWKPQLATYHRFDAQNRLEESMSSLQFAGAQLDFKEVYSYNANGDNHLIDEYTLTGGAWIPSGRTEIMYAGHQPIEVLISNSDGISFFPERRTNYAFTLFGAPRKQMDFEWNAAENRWNLFKTTDYAYDQEQRLGSKESALHYMEERELTVYAYVKDQNLYLEMGFNWNDDLFDWVLVSKKYYYYGELLSAGPMPAAVQMLRAMPNPTVERVRLQLDAPAFIQVYDSRGVVVSSGEYSADPTLDFSQLTTGTYMVVAQTDREIYTGRIVKH